MSTSRRQEMHVNSILAFWEGRKELFTKRENEILEALVQHGAMTDREVMIRLGRTDPNACRPRISEMLADGVLEEVGDKLCPATGKRVRIVSFKKDPRKPQAEFRFTEEEKAS